MAEDPNLQNELELARARDRDLVSNAQRRKKRKMTVIAACAALGIHGYFHVKDRLIAEQRTAQLAIRRLLYHEPRKGLVTAEIPTPEQSAWAIFLSSGSRRDEAWFEWVTLPHEYFTKLVDLCTPLWETTPIEANKGDYVNGTPRPQDLARRKLDCTATVAIALHFFAKPDSRSGIGKQFGLTETHTTKYMMFGLYIIVKALHSHPDARIEWKCNDPEYLKLQNDRIHRMARELKILFGILLVGWMDGVRFGICKKGKRKKQKEDYSGEKKTHLRKIILITDSEGIVVAAVVNCPGVWGDSKCTDVGGLYELIDSLLDGYSIGADTAFRGDLLNSKVTKILKMGDHLPAGMSHEDYELLEALLIKARQPAEWANNCLIQSFRRLRQCLGIFDDLNGELMMACLLLHNYRTRNCDRNQVKKYFNILEQEEKEEEAAAAAAEDEEDEEEEEEEELFQIGYGI